jgi:hypothetical protein
MSQTIDVTVAVKNSPMISSYIYVIHLERAMTSLWIVAVRNAYL